MEDLLFNMRKSNSRDCGFAKVLYFYKKVKVGLESNNYNNQLFYSTNKMIKFVKHF